MEILQGPKFKYAVKAIGQRFVVIALRSRNDGRIASYNADRVRDTNAWKSFVVEYIIYYRQLPRMGVTGHTLLAVVLVGKCPLMGIVT